MSAAPQETPAESVPFPVLEEDLVGAILESLDHALYGLMRLRADLSDDWKGQQSKLDEAEIHLRKAHQRVELTRVLARGRALRKGRRPS